MGVSAKSSRGSLQQQCLGTTTGVHLLSDPFKTWWTCCQTLHMPLADFRGRVQTVGSRLVQLSEWWLRTTPQMLLASLQEELQVCPSLGTPIGPRCK